MERLKSLVPIDLKQAIGEGRCENLRLTCSRLLEFFRPLPLFQQIMRELTDTDVALCCKDKSAALDLKRRGNECFSKGDFEQAVIFYSQALRYAPMKSNVSDLNLIATLYVNRASSMHRMGHLEECLRDCNRAVVLSPNYAKAWYRRGKANDSLSNHEISIRDLEVALCMETTNIGKNNIKQELNILTAKINSISGVDTRDNDTRDDRFIPLDESSKAVIKCVKNPIKGRGLISPNEIPPGTLIHIEDPLSAVVLKPFRETHCNFCFNEVPRDGIFCTSCTMPIYCSEKCLGQATGEQLYSNKEIPPVQKNLSADLARHVMDIISDNNIKTIDIGLERVCEHKHECGGTNWSAVLPPDIVLAGRVMANYIEKEILSGENSIFIESLDLFHHYEQSSPASKLESHIYAIVLSLCLHNYYKSKFACTEVSVSQLVILICQIKVNSMAIVHVKSTEGNVLDSTSSIEQVSVGQAIYSTGSFFNHSCQPDVHAYFLSRTLFVRTTEFVPAWKPLELSYGPQVGELDLLERQRSLEERYSFKCQCLSCSELTFSDLVINSFCCPKSSCPGVIFEKIHLKLLENGYVQLLSEEASHSLKLSLLVFKSDKDIKKVASKIFEKCEVKCHIDHSHCLSCGSYLDLEYAIKTESNAMLNINRLKDLNTLNKVKDDLIVEALGCLEQIRSVRHRYSKAVAQAEDNIAQFFVKIGDFEIAMKHCKASIKILAKIYPSKHIAIGHELIKLATIQLSLGHSADASDTVREVQTIFSLYYGSHLTNLFPYVDVLREQAINLALRKQAIS